MHNNVITMNVHGVARVESKATTPAEDYVERTVSYFDREGNLLLEVTAFPADHRTVPEIQEQPR